MGTQDQRRTRSGSRAETYAQLGYELASAPFFIDQCAAVDPDFDDLPSAEDLMRSKVIMTGTIDMHPDARSLTYEPELKLVEHRYYPSAYESRPLSRCPELIDPMLDPPLRKSPKDPLPSPGPKRGYARLFENNLIVCIEDIASVPLEDWQETNRDDRYAYFSRKP